MAKEEFIGKEYWRIDTKKRGFSRTHFISEEDAIKEAKIVEGKKWEENTYFYHYLWVKPQPGYYSEDSYQY